MQASSAISFHLPPESISAAASSGSPLSSTFVSDFSGLSIPRLSPLPFHFLTPAVFAFFRPLQFWDSTTQPLFLPFRSTGLRLTVAPTLPDSALASSVSTLSPAWLPMQFFRFPVLGSLFVSFHPALFRSHSCSTGARFPCVPRFPVNFRILSSASAFLPATKLLFLPFRASGLRLTVASSVLPFRFHFQVFRVPFLPVSRDFHSASRTQLSAGFLSPFPISLPQLFHRCLPFAFAFGLCPEFTLSFVRFFQDPATQPLRFPFPSS